MPLFEPSNPQEIKDFIHYAYDISDKYNIPVLLRTTTRVSHMRGVVNTEKYTKNTKNTGSFDNIGMHVPVPEKARLMHANLVDKISNLREISNNSPLNKVFDNGATIGIITSGGAYNYVADVVAQNNINVNILKLGFSHPFPEELVKEFLQDNDEVLVVEEVDPINEMETLAVAGANGITTKIHGKKDGFLPEIFEYTPDIIYDTLEKLTNFES